MAHLTLRPGHQLKKASGPVTTFVDQLFVRNNVTPKAILRQLIKRTWPDHAFRIGKFPTCLLFALTFGLGRLPTESRVHFDPVFAATVAGLARNSRNRLIFAADILHRKMTIETKAL
ncbi:MAG: hypothetical protein SH859_10660 [Hyphomicrobium aestuarii]|nr:hypothetical protein [Hyphomicrobium aestuarii]